MLPFDVKLATTQEFVALSTTIQGTHPLNTHLHAMPAKCISYSNISTGMQ